MREKIKDNNFKRTHRKLTVVDYVFIVLLVFVLFSFLFCPDNKLLIIISYMILVTSLIVVNIRDYSRKKNKGYE
jgi:L-asparagine transporter-like permease